MNNGYIWLHCNLNGIGEYWLIKLQDVTKFCTLFKFFYGASTNQHQAGAFASPFQNDRLCGIGTNGKLAIGWKLLSLKLSFVAPKNHPKQRLLHQKFLPIFTKGTTSPADLMTKPMPRGAWWLRRAIESCYLFTVDLFDVIEYHELWGPHISRWLFCSCRSFFLPTNNTVPVFLANANKKIIRRMATYVPLLDFFWNLLSFTSSPFFLVTKPLTFFA